MRMRHKHLRGGVQLIRDACYPVSPEGEIECSEEHGRMLLGDVTASWTVLSPPPVAVEPVREPEPVVEQAMEPEAAPQPLQAAVEPEPVVVEPDPPIEPVAVEPEPEIKKPIPEPALDDLDLEQLRDLARERGFEMRYLRRMGRQTLLDTLRKKEP